MDLSSVVRQNKIKKSLGHGRMTSLSDTLTVGLVLVLLFGSIALYLYTRIQQAEQKISLLESILLDMKMSSEVKSYSELPADSKILSTGQGQQYAPYDNDDDDDKSNEDDMLDYYPGAVIGQKDNAKSGTSTPSVSGSINDTTDSEVNQYKSVIASAISDSSDNDVNTSEIPSASKVSVNYESMTLKELQTLAKTRGISGAGSMKKGAIIEALKTSDRSQTTIEPGSIGTSVFLETSSSFPGPVAVTPGESE
jgi:hypothetical protein